MTLYYKLRKSYIYSVCNISKLIHIRKKNVNNNTYIVHVPSVHVRSLTIASEYTSIAFFFLILISIITIFKGDRVHMTVNIIPYYIKLASICFLFSHHEFYSIMSKQTFRDLLKVEKKTKQ